MKESQSEFDPTVAPEKMPKEYNVYNSIAANLRVLQK